jgi:DNA-binding transcriptional regulator LsrR (DeoR family)
MISDRTWRMAQVAKLYYQDNLNQDSIAEKLNISRSTISRLLDDARSNGIVEVKIKFPWQRSERLETALCKKFGLTAARVLKTVPESESDLVLNGMGFLGAQFFQEIVQPGTVVAITSGRAVYHTVEALETHHLDLNVVQMMGVANCQNPQIDGPELAQLMVHRLGGRYTYMQAPFLIMDSEVHRKLFEEIPFREIISLISQARYAITGIGTLDTHNSSLLRTGFSVQSLEELTRCGAVGEICGQTFNISGETVYSDKAQKPVSLDLKYIKEIETVIGVAGGAAKAMAILGALNGNILDVLVTDQQAAEVLLF